MRLSVCVDSVLACDQGLANPVAATCVHYDSNYGADVILAFRLQSLKGGEHVMLSVDGSEAVVVETSELGVLIGGCHQHLLHGNLGTTDGGRMVLAWYMPEALRKEAPNRF